LQVYSAEFWWLTSIRWPNYLYFYPKIWRVISSSSRTCLSSSPIFLLRKLVSSLVEEMYLFFRIYISCSLLASIKEILFIKLAICYFKAIFYLVYYSLSNLMSLSCPSICLSLAWFRVIERVSSSYKLF